MNYFLILLVALVTGTSLFKQDFNGSGNLKKYISNKPKSGQFNAIDAAAPHTVEIADGKLRLSKNGPAVPAGQPYFVRNTNLDGNPEFISAAFKIKGTGKGLAYAQMFFGGDLSAEGSLDADAKVYVRLGFNLQEKGFTIRNPNQGTNGTVVYEGEQALVWYINKSGQPQTYTAPDGSSQTVPNNRWDLYVGKTKEISAGAVTERTQSLANFKMVFATSMGVVDIDDIEITDLLK